MTLNLALKPRTVLGAMYAQHPHTLLLQQQYVSGDLRKPRPGRRDSQACCSCSQDAPGIGLIRPTRSLFAQS